MKEIFLTTDDNVKIAANHFENGHKDVIIIVHGWFMTKDSKPFFELSKHLNTRADVISIDCRGHGKSDGTYTFTSEETKDVKAAVDYSKKRYEKIFLMGFSLGGALVLLHGAQQHDVSKIIAVSPPYNFEKIENCFWSPDAWIPTLQKCELKTWFSIRADLKSLIFAKKPDYAKAAQSLNIPVLYIGGEKDPTVKIHHTQKLFEMTNCEKKLEIFENGLHAEDLFIQDTERFLDICFKWIYTI